MRILLVDYMGSIHFHFHRKEKDPCHSFLLNLREIIKQFKIDKTFILLEGGKSSYRLGKNPEYKAQRESTRSKWSEADQKSYLKFKKDANNFATTVLPYFGLEPLRVWGTEADDIAGFLVGNVPTGIDNQILLLSSDKDFHQLLKSGVVQGCYATMCRAGYPCPPALWLSRKGFEKEYGIPVHNWIWKKCLSGDTGDNVKGFNKVGDGTALKLIQKYGSIEGIRDNLQELHVERMSQTAKDAMKEDFDLVYRNYDLMNLNFSEGEEVEIFQADGVAYLHDIINNLHSSKKLLDKVALSEVCYEYGWLEMLDPEFTAPFEKLF